MNAESCWQASTARAAMRYNYTCEESCTWREGRRSSCCRPRRQPSVVAEHVAHNGRVNAYWVSVSVFILITP